MHKRQGNEFPGLEPKLQTQPPEVFHKRLRQFQRKPRVVPEPTFHKVY